MDMPRTHPSWGTELDWLGVDEHLETVEKAVARIRQLPVIGAAAHVTEQDGANYTDWVTYSTQGFYAYDWKVWGGPYLRLSTPTTPITIEGLTPELAAIARYAHFALRFADAVTVEVDHRAEP